MPEAVHSYWLLLFDISQGHAKLRQINEISNWYFCYVANLTKPLRA